MVLMLIVMMTMTMIRMALMEKKMMLTESYARHYLWSPFEFLLGFTLD